MTIDERSWHELYERAQELLGPKEATTLMAGLRRSGWDDVATRQDLHVTSTELRGEMTELRGEMAGLGAELRGEISGLRVEMADFRAEIKSDMAAQTRTLILACAGMMTSGVLATGALAFAAAGLA